MKVDCLRFHGNVYNNSGVYSEATSTEFEIPLDLSKYDGVALDVRSEEAMNYKLGLKDRKGKDSITWEADFTAPANGEGNFGWNRIEIPFSDFASHRGFKRDVGKMDLSEVHSFVIRLEKVDYLQKRKYFTTYLNDEFVEGNFELEFKDLQPYG